MPESACSPEGYQQPPLERSGLLLPACGAAPDWVCSYRNVRSQVIGNASDILWRAPSDARMCLVVLCDQDRP